MTTPLILCYHLEPERIARLRTLCAVQKVRLKPVPPEAENQPVGALAGILPPQEAADQAGDGVTREMLVLCQFSEPALQRFLQGFRQFGIPPVALKAVLTPTNALWSAARLFQELQREHQAMHPEES